MNKKLLLDIGFSLLKARFRQTLVAAIGVTFSITMFITLLSFMTGLNKLLDGLILNRTPHVRLYNEIKPSAHQPITGATSKNTYNFISSIKASSSREEIYNSGAIIQSIKKDDRVFGIAPKLTSPAFYNAGNVRIAGSITGVDVLQESKLFHFTDYITTGNPTDLSTIANSIILGKPLAETLLANIGDLVYLTTPSGEVMPLKLVGFFESGLRDYDKVQGFTSITTAQKILGKPANYITELYVKLNDVNIAPAVAKEYQAKYNIQAEDIQTANSQFETGTFIRTLISYVVGITLLIVAGFGIYNILNMMIYEKMDTIAILKATGFSGKDVRRIFLFIALSIGFFGGIVGLLLGYGLSAVIDAIPFNTPALPTIKTYPINYNPVYYFIAISFALVTTWLAGLFPSAKAGRVDPVVIIRGK